LLEQDLPRLAQALRQEGVGHIVVGAMALQGLVRSTRDAQRRLTGRLREPCDRARPLRLSPGLSP
jgi:hypothetical protein